MEKMNEKHVNMQMVEIDHSKFAVEIISGNASVNLTQMAKPFGSSKKPDNWLRSDEAKEYLNVLSVSQKRDTVDLLKVKRGGQNQGTWCNDYRIAMRFAQWLSPQFSIMVDELLVNLLRGNSVLSEPFNGIEPAIYQGKAWYNYLDVLQSLGYSRKSGSVAQRKAKSSRHFCKIYGRNFVTIGYCNFLKSTIEYRQLTLQFYNASLANTN